MDNIELIDLLLLILASITYGLLIVSPHKRIHEIITKKNSNDYNLLPLIGMLFNSIAWFSYVLYIKTWPLIFLNCFSIGYTLYNIMIITYYSTKEKEMKYIRILIGVVIPLELTIFTLSNYIFINQTKNILGLQLLFVGILYKLSHISKIITIIKNKNSKLIDINFTILSTFNGIFWLIYYTLVQYDLYLIIWSIFSLIIFTILLICKILYYKTEEAAENNDSKEQDIELGNS